MSEWQSMKTAPKNPEGEGYGPYILIWHDYDHGIYEVRWSYESGKGEWAPKRKLEVPLNPNCIHFWRPSPEGPKKVKKN